jgi:hypothetical protein
LTLPHRILAGSARCLPGVLGHLSLPLCVSFVHQDFGTPPTFHVQAFVTCAGLLCPRLASAHSSHRLLAVVALEHACRPPRVLRTHFLPIYPSHLLPRLPDDYRALNVFAFSPRRGCLVCALCSSGRGFAYRFLQTPPRGGTLAVRLTVPVIRVRRGLAPPSECALPGAQIGKAGEIILSGLDCSSVKELDIP